jgi:deazaflavin-dependent oxidoreductase (nitroreductase family)
VPLLGIPDGEKLIIIASNWGQGHHPGWFYNLRANPEVLVEHEGETRACTAREVKGLERQRCWQLAIQYYPGYEAYKKWANGREIPVVLLAPKEKGEDDAIFSLSD